MCSSNGCNNELHIIIDDQKINLTEDMKVKCQSKPLDIDSPPGDGEWEHLHRPAGPEAEETSGRILHN